MSDITLIAEDILETMHAMDEACHAMKAMKAAHRVVEAADEKHDIKQTLHEETDLATFDVFRDKMMELHERLSNLKIVLDNEEAFAVDELVDALSMATQVTAQNIAERRA